VEEKPIIPDLERGSGRGLMSGRSNGLQISVATCSFGGPVEGHLAIKKSKSAFCAH